MAKLTAVLCDGQQNIDECFGIAEVRGRNMVLVAIRACDRA